MLLYIFTPYIYILYTVCTYRHVQCVLNFLPNHAEDGGTLVVPHFPSYLPVFCEEYAHLRRPLPWVQFPAEVEALLLQRAHRVTMREVVTVFLQIYVRVGMFLSYVQCILSVLPGLGADLGPDDGTWHGSQRLPQLPHGSVPEGRTPLSKLSQLSHPCSIQRH